MHIPLKPHRILAAAGLIALLSACAAPNTPAKPAGGHGNAAFMGSYDVNRDGVVTRDEYDTVRKQRFMAADSNGDGWLSEEEYVGEFESRLKQQYLSEGRAPDSRYASAMKQAHVRFSLVNRARDGRYTVEEDNLAANRTFKQADSNGDGVVNQDDVSQR